jgi:hypothetical protein
LHIKFSFALRTGLLVVALLMATSAWAQSNVSGGGGGTSTNSNTVGAVFSVLNYGWVDDDSTDNCGTPVTNFLADVNGYSGPGAPVAVIPMGPAKKAYKLATAGCQLIFTIPVTIHLWGNLDCAQPATTANCIQFGPTTTNGTGTYTNAQIFKYMIDGGGTLTGGATLANAGIEVESGTVDSLITELNFKNFGATNATIGSCTNYAVLYDYPVAEGTISYNHWQVTDTGTGRCAFANPSGAATGSNTIFYIDNVFGGQNATNSSGCSSQAIIDGGSLGLITDSNIYAFAIPVRIQGIGHRIHHNQFDNAGCLDSGGTQAAIQFGATSSATAVGPLSVMGNIVQSTTAAGHSKALLSQAHDSTATLFSATVVGNISNGSGGGSYGALITASTNCTPDLATGSMCYEYGNTAFTNLVPCGTTNVGWQLETLFAACSAATQAANVSATPLMTMGTIKSMLVSCQIMLTRAPTTSGTLPSCQIAFTDVFTNVAETVTLTPAYPSGSAAPAGCQGNATSPPAVGNSCQGSALIVPKNGVVINYQTTGYVSSGATTQQYQVFVRANEQ